MEKKVDIVYFGDIRDVNGVNLVTNAFLRGKEIFAENDLTLQNIYHSNGVLNCATEITLPIGTAVGTIKYKFTRVIRTVLKKILDSKIPLFAWFKFRQNIINPAKQVIDLNAQNFNSDYIIFQDFVTAYFYYNNYTIAHKKSILVLHSSEDILEQLRLSFPGVFNSKYKTRVKDMLQFAINKVDRVVYVSKTAAEKDKSGKANVTFVYNGLPDLNAMKFKNKQTVINFVSVGSMNYRKGQEVIVEAIKLLSPEIQDKSHFYFIGDGAQLPELKELSKIYGIENFTHFLGSRNDVAKLLEDMDVLVLMSKSEGLPLSIIEGLRQGLFIVTTNVGGTPEMVTDMGGLIIKRDATELKKAIEEIVINKRVSQEARQSSRLHYERNFTLKSMIEKYAFILKSIE